MGSAGEKSQAETGVLARFGGGEFDGRKARFQLLFFVQFAAGSGIIVFRNVYLDGMGMSGAEMGVIGFLMLATGVAVQPLWGLVTDYWHIERAILVVGALVSALALLTYPFGASLTDPFTIIAVGTAVFSAFRAPIVPIATGMVLSRGYDFGHIRSFGSLAFGIGSLGVGLVVAAAGLVSIVYIYIGGMVVLMAVAWSLPDGSAAPGDADDDTDDPSIARAVKALVTNWNFMVVVTAMFLFRLSFMGGEAFLSVYMRAVHASLVVGPWSLSPDGLTGLVWALNTGLEAGAFVYAARLGLSYKWLLVVGGTMVGVPNVVYGVTTDPLLILAVQAFGGIGFALLSLGAVNLVHAVAAERIQSSAQTFLSGLSLGLGGAIGQVIAGHLLDTVGVQEMYLVIAVVGFLGAAVGLLVTHRGRLDASDAAA
ncbi:MFS transporter [Haladaptatus sp.]|uniref:MFS transporter n=1 Tax=Haladaptatus sp. TaxID=1973141 RepID=UPI003C5F2A8A